MAWAVEFDDAFEAELAAERDDVGDEVAALAGLLREFGPHLRRPYCDTLKGSKHPNMKELRFSLHDGEWRVAFAFDPERSAILLVGGSKSGVAEKRFYRNLIRIADGRFDAHLERLLAKNGRCEMTVSLDEHLKKLEPERRARIEARTKGLIAEELTLRDLRQAEHLTQEQMAKLLGVEQENISRLERRADLLLSTLSSYVAAMGGKLRLIAEFPNRQPVAITLSDILDQRDQKPRPQKVQREKQSLPPAE